MSTAALVACSDSKCDGRTISWQLYSSTLFQKSWTVAMLAGDPYVMSAEHELVSPTDRLDRYDEDMREWVDEERFYWGRDVVAQIPGHYENVLLLGGRHYVEPVKGAIQDMEKEFDVYDPYGFAIGNGQQMSIADDLTDLLLRGWDTVAAVGQVEARWKDS